MVELQGIERHGIELQDTERQGNERQGNEPQHNGGERASRIGPSSPVPFRRLAPGEPAAQIATLSAARRNALVACFNAGGLHKRDGAWHGPLGGMGQSGVTIADLARDGMLTVTKTHRLGSAQLTARGNWFARTLIHDEETAK